MRLKTVVSGRWQVRTELLRVRTRLVRRIPASTEVVKAVRSVLLALLLILLSPLSISHFSLVKAQSESATLSGRVTDPQGGAVVGAEVVFTNMDTGVEERTKSNGEGIYVFAAVQPGRYRVAAGSTGFKTLIKENLVLHTQDEVAENFSLPLGSVSETITVDANRININTTDATVSTTIDRNFAENLPLNGRSFETLILLTPGTTLLASSSGVTGNGGAFSVNGQRTNANSFTVDGVSADLGDYLNANAVKDQSNGANPSLTIAGTTQGLVSVDALQEFKIQTSTYAPEFGRQPGGQVSLLTRSGTNDFHGTAFDYLRNTVLDANNWFNDHATPFIPKGAERQNDFGGTLGGPIYKDKTFFFFSYEGLRLLLPQSGVMDVPDSCLRGGGGPCAAGEGPAAPVFQPILNSWPLPTPNGTGSTYTYSQSVPTNLDSYLIKIDHAFGARVHLFGKYTDTPESATQFQENLLFVEGLRDRDLTLGTDVTIRPNLLNELRLSYNVNVSTLTHEQNIIGGAQPFSLSLLFPSPFTPAADDAIWLLQGLPNAGPFETTPGSAGKYSERQIDVIDNVSYAVGRHQLKWGVDYRRLFPILAGSPVIPFFRVTSLGDLEAGVVSRLQVSSFLTAHPIYTNFSVYGQDTWRASDRLSVTYGLRWDLNPSPGERDGIYPLNVIGVNNPATATLAPINSPMYKTTYNNFAPRVGVAYQIRQSPSHVTVMRGGFGVFYDLNSETFASGFSNAPFQNSSVQTSVPFPVPNNSLTVPPVPAPLTPPYSQINAIDPNLKLPYTLQWNASLEQQLGNDQSITVSYVASAGYRLLRMDSLSNFSPSFTTVNFVQNNSSSNYQALQLQFNRHLARDIQALASYTYSHSIDDASNAGGGLSYSGTGATLPSPSLDRGNSDFDVRHALRGAFTYTVPEWKANLLSRAILGGWSTEMVGIAQSALPDNVIGDYYAVNAPTGTNYIYLRPNVTGQPFKIYGAQCASVFQALGELAAGASCPGGMGLNPAAFTPVPANADGSPTQLEGTLGRNVVRGFGLWQVDFGLHRQFNLTERIHLQFRSEFFNVFNHPNFAQPYPNLYTHSLFGLANTTLNESSGSLNPLYQPGGPRSIQMALKVLF